MTQSGPIIIVEDDHEDQELYVEAFKSIKAKNELIFFITPIEALDFLRATEKAPFLILSDINMPDMNGIEFREQIESDKLLKAKNIPFVFLSTSACRTDVNHAYHLTMQGFFVKPPCYDELEKRLRLIIDYWTGSVNSNSQ